MKSNKPCYYCGTTVEGKRDHFCSEVCNSKYWSGVYAKKWKRGQYVINSDDKPTKEELEKYDKRHKARRLAYVKYKKGTIAKCDLCKTETKKIHRHHQDYNKACMIVCTKCHGFIKRYHNLQKMLTNTKEVR